MAVARENLSIEKRFLRKSLRTTVPDLLKKDGAGEIKFYGKIALDRVALKIKRGQRNAALRNTSTMRMHMDGICKIII